MEEEKIKICDMEIHEDFKKILTYISIAKTIPQIAAKFDKSYTYVYQKLSIWEAKGWVQRMKTTSGRTVWLLTEKMVL
jgi:transposase